MPFDDSSESLVESMAISKFKATCLATLERVRATGRPLLITRFGKPIAEILPPSPVAAKSDWMGTMRGTIEIHGDLVAPTGDLADWDVLK